MSRNTVLAAYDELMCLDLIRGRRGAGTFVSPRPVTPAFNLRQVMRDAMFPSRRTFTATDQDGNELRLNC